jgi:hypothetical protein
MKEEREGMKVRERNERGGGAKWRERKERERGRNE